MVLLKVGDKIPDFSCLDGLEAALDERYSEVWIKRPLL